MRAALYFILAAILTSTAFTQQPAAEEAGFTSQSIEAHSASTGQTVEASLPVSTRQGFIAPSVTRYKGGVRPEVDVRQWQPFDPLTIGVQSVFGAAGGAAGGFVGFHAGLFLSYGTGGRVVDMLYAGILGSYVFATMVGAPLGVYLGGETMGGEGTYWGAVEGAAVGSLIGISAVVLDGREQAGIPVMFAAVLISPIIGYHLSAPSAETEGRLSESLPLTQPIVPVSARPNDSVTPRPDLQMTVLSIPF